MVDIERALQLPDISIPSHDIRSLRQQTSVLLRLPSIPGAAVERYFSGGRSEEAARVSAAMGLAYAEDRRRALIMRAKARAHARIAQAIAEGRL